MSRTKRDILDTESMLQRLATVLVCASDVNNDNRYTVTAEQARADAESLRRISMTLHRWHELECGTDAGHVERDQKWAIERAAWPASDRIRWWDGDTWNRKTDRRTYDDRDKTQIVDRLPTTQPWGSEDFARANAQGFPSDGAWRETGEKTYFVSANSGHRSPTPDREAGALARLARVMARYPTLQFYVQGDPRGCALYILKPVDVPQGGAVDAYYSRGLAVHQ